MPDPPLVAGPVALHPAFRVGGGARSVAVSERREGAPWFCPSPAALLSPPTFPASEENSGRGMGRLSLRFLVVAAARARPGDTHTKSSKRRQPKQSQFDSYKKSGGVRGLTDHDYEDEPKK